MKRVEFRVEENEHDRILEQAARERMSVSEFIRTAAMERLRVGYRVSEDQRRTAEMQALLEDIRVEAARLRTDARADHQRWREAAEESLRRNEEAMRCFVLMLTEAVAG